MKNVSKSVRLSEKVFNYINDYEGQGFNQKFENIILILPDIDLHESWKIVNRIGKVPTGSDLSKLNWHLISSPCNSALATYTTCIGGRKYEDVADEIINHINEKKKAKR